MREDKIFELGFADLEEREAFEKHQNYVDTTATARVEMKARIISRAKGEDPNLLYIDAFGPVWEKYIGQALEQLEKEKVIDEDYDKMENECRKILDKEIVEWLWENAPASGNIMLFNAAKRLSALSSENELLKSDLNHILAAYIESKNS